MMVMLACMTFGLAIQAKAQICSEEVLFYAKTGTSDVCYAVKFNCYRDNLVIQRVFQDGVKKHLEESKNYYEDNWKQGYYEFRQFEYDPIMSTSTKEVYKWEGKVFTDKIIGYDNGPWGMGQPIYESFEGYRYIAISKDKYSLIRWSEKKNNGNGAIIERKDYTRIPKEDLLPKAANYDFLND